MPQSEYRIANLLGLRDEGHGYDVPPTLIGSGFASEVVCTRIATTFINELDRSFMDMIYAEAGLRAQDAGFDAAIINTFGDYGLRALRGAASIPVFGSGQSGMQLAAGLGERFAVLTVWPVATRRMYARLVSDYGFESRCTEVRHVIGNDEIPAARAAGGLVEAMRAGRADALDRMEAEARDLIKRGADVIVLGCTCMSPMQAELTSRLGHPVVDPLAAAHKLAEVALTLGIAPPPAPSPAINAELIREMVSAFAATAAARPPVAEACGDTCAIIRAPVEQIGA
jgi:allantoin racemase